MDSTIHLGRATLEGMLWARHFPGLRSLPQREQESCKQNIENREDLYHQYKLELKEAESTRSL